MGMFVNWKMSIGFPGAHQTGETELDDDDLKGRTREEIDEMIERAIWEYAMQYVDVYPANKEELDKAIAKLVGEEEQS